jgi:hypothetical protein
MFGLRGRLGSPSVFCGVRVAHFFSFLGWYFVCFVFCFVCLCPVSCLSNIVSYYGLSILSPFGLL